MPAPKSKSRTKSSPKKPETAKKTSEAFVVGGIDVKKAEKHYKAQYVGYYSIPGIGDGPYLVFWRPKLNEREKKLGYDQYFGLYRNPINTDDLRIFNAKKIRDAKFPAIEQSPGKFLCSRSVHNNVGAPNGAWLDGGPYYTRHNPAHPPTHTMTIVDGKEAFTPIVKEASEQPPALVAPAVAESPDRAHGQVSRLGGAYVPEDAQSCGIDELIEHLEAMHPGFKQTLAVERAKRDLHRRYKRAAANGLALLLHDVGSFHIAMDQPVRYTPQLIDKAESDLRIDLIAEEFDELKLWVEAGDICKIADALTDILYVTVGAMLHWGIPGDDCWDEVQDSNMAKKDPATGKVLKRADGKVLKPPGWQEPNFKRALGLESEP